MQCWLLWVSKLSKYSCFNQSVKVTSKWSLFSECDCDVSLTKKKICDSSDGKCLCRKGFSGDLCEKCDDNHFTHPFCTCKCFQKIDKHFSLSVYTSACNCYDEGTVNCDQQTGSCNCKSNYQGPRCADCAAGYFGPECKSKPKLPKFLKILVLETQILFLNCRVR